MTVRKISKPSPEHEADMAVISEALWRTRVKQGWCGEFEGVLDEINGQLRVKLPEPTPSVNVTLTMQFLIPVEWDADKDRRENELAAHRFIQDMSHADRKEMLVKNIENVRPTVYDISTRAANVPR